MSGQKNPKNKQKQPQYRWVDVGTAYLLHRSRDAKKLDERECSDEVGGIEIRGGCQR
jgi:hypothetical protein